MSRTIYLLRHGQTKFNLERRMQGHCDSALTELGVAQARAMGATLRAELGSLDNWQVFASPLGRTMQTAELVCAELGLASRCIQPEPRLIESRFWRLGAAASSNSAYAISSLSNATGLAFSSAGL
ncbi:phosphoglycerate mutase family protein [Deefgea sp. CFH1-16]|uniref:phosphoglycerate mutase family protein n=1 Tax=Deefgea sp. CFH1-16 TaxID=2675457 RepID=UPI00194036B4